MGLNFAALFAFCDLHASRWRLRTPRAQRLGAFVECPMYYDRQGFPIPGEVGDEHAATLRWATMQADRDYARLAWDDLPDGSSLSTVWLGLDHNMCCGRPAIFETVRFPAEATVVRYFSADETPQEIEGRPAMHFPDPETGEPVEQLRYDTEEEALACHHEIVRRIRLREGH